MAQLLGVAFDQCRDVAAGRLTSVPEDSPQPVNVGDARIVHDHGAGLSVAIGQAKTSPQESRGRDDHGGEEEAAIPANSGGGRP